MADLKTWLVLIGLGTLSIACHSKTNEDGSIKTPLFTRLEAPGVTFESEENGSRHIPRLSQKMIYPFNLTAQGPLGGKTIRTIRAAEDLANLKIEAGIIKDKDSNPIFLADLAKLCPRLSPKR